MLYMLANMVQKDPWVVTGAIAKPLGWIINGAFNAVYYFTQSNSLGISIIALTIVVRFIMLPLAAKSHKSMVAMQRLNPEIEKIKNKYGQTKDPELTRKMNTEIQALYSKNKVNPLSGCLPMLIQMPIFFALMYVMNQSYLYITQLSNIYQNLASTIISVPNYTSVMVDVIIPHVPEALRPFDIAVADNMVRALNKLSPAEWQHVLTVGLPSIADSATLEHIRQIFTQKQNIEMFLGLNLLDNAGWAFPGVIIPILTAATTFLTSWLGMKVQQNNANPSSGMQQKVMMAAMPLVMGFFTVRYPAGVGIYWIASSVFQAVQQVFLNRKYKADDPRTVKEIVVKEAKKK